MSGADKLARRPDKPPKGRLETRRQTMRVMVFAKMDGDGKIEGPPTPEMLEAFAAMDRFTEELVQAGVFVAAAGLKNDASAKRVLFDGPRRTIIDGPFAESKEVVVGFSIWQVKDMDEAMAWAKRAPNAMSGKSEMEIRPFYEAEDLAEYITPEQLAAQREGDRGKLGVA